MPVRIHLKANVQPMCGNPLSRARGKDKLSGLPPKAPVAQLDRVSASEAEGCGFDPRQAHQFCGLQVGLEFGLQIGFAQRADHLFLNNAFLEDQQGWNGADLKFGR